MKTLNRLWIALAFLSAHACAIYEPRFGISSVVPQRVLPSYIVDNPHLWPDVAPYWKQKSRKLLALRVTTNEKLEFGLSSDVNEPKTAMTVSDCSARIAGIYQAGPRYIGMTADGKFEYEKLIEYKTSVSNSDPTYYDIFDNGADLCIVIQTIKMGLRGKGAIYTVEMNKYKDSL